MPQQIIAKTAAVAAGHPLGAAAGLEILRNGGNAVDAAVGAMIALSVVIPGSVGLGGYGGSAVLYDAPRGRTVAVDFDSRAPLGFHEGDVTADPESNYYGARSVTVPAVVAGLGLILRDFGTKSWSEVSLRAIRLAEEGFEFDAEHKRHLDRCTARIDRQSLEGLFPDNPEPKIDDRWRQRDLARLLQRLADEGPQAFYHGEVALRIVRYLRERGGILTKQDFESYQPQIVETLRATVCGFELYTPPPPSGGITSLAIVQTIERLLQARSREQGAGGIEPWSAEYFHLLAEVSKSCWRERNQHLGDPDFVTLPIEELLSDKAAASRIEEIQSGAPHSPLSTPHSSSPHTANVLAIDAEGNLISLTATQGWMYGSHLVVDGLGLVLNHGMSRFDYQTGHANAPAPGKRMQHNMAPMIAMRCSPPRSGEGPGEGRPAFAYGMPGGPKIVNVTAQLALNTIAFGGTPAQTIATPRLHTDGDEPLLVSTHMPDPVMASLQSIGHTVRREEDMGGPVNVLAVDHRTGAIDIASGEATGAVAGL